MLSNAECGWDCLAGASLSAGGIDYVADLLT